MRLQYVCSIANEPNSDSVFLDNSGFNQHVSPRYGWELLKTLSTINGMTSTGSNISLLTSISKKEFYLQDNKGSINFNLKFTCNH